MHKLIRKRFKQVVLAITIAGITIPPLVLIVKRMTSYTSSNVNSFFTPHSVTCTMANIFSPDLKTAIQEALTVYVKQESILQFSPKACIAHLQEAFPVIKSITFSYTPPHAMHAAIEGTVPKFFINGKYILGNQPRLFAPEFFAEVDCSKLLPVSINENLIKSNLKLSARINKFVQAIPEAMFKTYAISYNTPSSIELIPHHAICNANIITDEKHFSLQAGYDAISGIFQDLCNKGLITKKIIEAKKYRPLTFDVRIGNQVIVTFNKPAIRGNG
jgi:hypothetical protein